MTPAGHVVHLVVPEGIDDPERVSGGNVYDRRAAHELSRLGWDVRMSQVGVGGDAHAALSRAADGDIVLVDGLVASRSPDAVAEAAGRLRMVVLAHMFSAASRDADAETIDGERRALRAARCVIATSEWTRAQLVGRRLVEPDRVVVARPGSDPVPDDARAPASGSLLCVGVVSPHKGQDTLVEALALLGAREHWACTIAGSVATSPEFAARIAARATAAGIRDRVTMTGVLSRDDLDRAYRHAELLVAPSRVESYGMAIADALRRGIPVVASDTGGIPATVGRGRAAVLVPPDRPEELSAALRRWMTDPGLRARMNDAARSGRSDLPTWRDTAARIAATLADVR